jgi:NAD(P)-dependent dehydrogenase (short-subunit alcohol dehydrogenase family)
MDEQGTVVITGANSGLGLETARRLAAAGVPLLLACRQRESAEQARALCAATPGAGPVAVAELDLSDLNSVRRFAAQVPRLRSLVCNAGVQVVSELRRSAQGHELTFATNHLGHFLLARLTLPAFAAHGSIVFVSSNTHDPRQWTGMPAPRLDDLAALADGSAFAEEAPAAAGRRRYTSSKLCNVLCSHELALRLAASSSLRVCAFDPGLMPGTGLARENGCAASWAWNHLLPVATVLAPNVNTVATSAARLADVVLGKLPYQSGAYVSAGAVQRSSEQSYDRALAVRLWELSSALVGLPGELEAYAA